MEAVSVCPFRVGSIVWQPRRGAWAFTVVCKATYRLMPVESPLAEEQEYPTDDDNHWNDDPARSLYCPSDLVPFKARADVMLVGHAFAPRKEPVRSVIARLIAGGVDKAIEVFVDRAWGQDGLLREGPRFVKMPLRYERASGGPETSNPVGMRLDARPDAYGNVAIPNLQPTGILLSNPGDSFEPIGFGPIAPTWPPRRDRLGAYAASWRPGAWHQRPLPDDFDKGYFNAAPRDQQIDDLRDNERIILENLHPEHPRLVTSLPGVHPRAFVEHQRGGPVQNLQLACDTLWIDTDRKICTLTWRGSLPLEQPAQQGRVLVALEQPGQRLGWADIERLTTEIEDTDDGSALRGYPAAPAPVSPSRSALAGLSAPRATRAGEPPEEPLSATGEMDPREPDRAITKIPDRRMPDLPFVRAGSARPPPPPPGSGSGLPFAPAADGRPAPPPTHAGLPFAPASDAVSRSNPPPPSNTGLPFAPAAPAPRAPRPTIQTDQASLGESAPAWLTQSRSSGLAPHPPQPVQMPPPVPQRHPSAPAMPAVVPAPTPAPVPPAPAPLAPAPVPMAPAPVPMAPAPVPPAPVPSPITPAPVPPAPVASPMAPAPVPMSGGGMLPGVGAGAAGASDAAAAASSWSPTPAPMAAPAAPAPAPVMIRPSARQPSSRDIVDLLWFDPKSLDGIRKHPRWKDLLVDDKPYEPAGGFDDDIEEAPAPDPPETRDRRDVFAVLTRADSSDPEGINESLSDAVRDDGTFVPPLVMMAGELQFPFDELETLKATVTAVTPLVAGDKKLKDTVDTVNELLKTPWLQSSTGVAEGLTGKIKEAFAQGNRMLPPSYLDQHTERMLLEQRHYQRRTVFGEPSIRSLLMPLVGTTPIPTYLPDALGKQLPMFQRFRVRLVAEVHLQQDQYEAYPSALRVVAIARVHSLAVRR